MPRLSRGFRWRLQAVPEAVIRYTLHPCIHEAHTAFILVRLTGLTVLWPAAPAASKHGHMTVQHGVHLINALPPHVTQGSVVHALHITCESMIVSLKCYCAIACRTTIVNSLQAGIVGLPNVGKVRSSGGCWLVDSASSSSHDSARVVNLAAQVHCTRTAEKQEQCVRKQKYSI